MIEANILMDTLTRSFGLYEDLVSELTSENLTADLRGLRSNTLGQQLWCVIGARESYSKAIEAGGWQDFSCSLSYRDSAKKDVVRESLMSSRKSLLECVTTLRSLTHKQQSLVMDLIEHEAQHHGQIIRYLYANNISIPASWKQRYNLD